MSETEKCHRSSGAWGTLEELLLACAVNRHGIDSWNFVAMELQKRSTQKASSNNFSNAFTPQICEQRYHELKRRFNVIVDGEDDVVGGRDRREDLPMMIEELRKLRVEELRRELERRDALIVSLELEVKRLEAERERRSPEEEADLEPREPAGNFVESDSTNRIPKPSPSEPDGNFIEPDSTNRIPKQSPSGSDGNFIESDSTNRMQKPSQAEPVPVQLMVVSEPVKEFGCGFEEKAIKLRPPVSESKQRSARLPAGGRRRSNGGVGRSREEIEAEESPANKKIGVNSKPLIKFLEIVRSNKHGSVFQRRFPGQKTQKYKKLIRQHMDFETVESKLEQGIYCECHPKFYRDLLLIFTNSILFFPKSSTQHLAARELRKLVKNEITPNPKPDPVFKKPLTSMKQNKTISVYHRRNKKGDQGENRKSSNEEDEPISKRMKQNSPRKEEEEEKGKVMDLSKKKVVVRRKMESGRLGSGRSKRKRDGEVVGITTAKKKPRRGK